jgi:hypothetical protein
MKLSKLKLNDKNPRFIRDEKFELLKANIEKYPRFLEKRPIVYDPEDGNKILAGNMRFRALKALGFKEIPEAWAVSAADLSEEEKAAFTIIDNVPYGQWDWDALANEWDSQELTDWGMDMPDEWGEGQADDEGDFSDDGANIESKYGVMVICNGEQHQLEVFEALSSGGYECKVVIS